MDLLAGQAVPGARLSPGWTCQRDTGMSASVLARRPLLRVPAAPSQARLLPFPGIRLTLPTGQSFARLGALSSGRCGSRRTVANVLAFTSQPLQTGSGSKDTGKHVGPVPEGMLSRASLSLSSSSSSSASSVDEQDATLTASTAALSNGQGKQLQQQHRQAGVSSTTVAAVPTHTSSSHASAGPSPTAFPEGRLSWEEGDEGERGAATAGLASVSRNRSTGSHAPAGRMPEGLLSREDGDTSTIPAAAKPARGAAADRVGTAFPEGLLSREEGSVTSVDDDDEAHATRRSIARPVAGGAGFAEGLLSREDDNAVSVDDDDEASATRRALHTAAGQIAGAAAVAAPFKDGLLSREDDAATSVDDGDEAGATCRAAAASAAATKALLSQAGNIMETSVDDDDEAGATRRAADASRANNARARGAAFTEGRLSWEEEDEDRQQLGVQQQQQKQLWQQQQRDAEDAWDDDDGVRAPAAGLGGINGSGGHAATGGISSSSVCCVVPGTAIAAAAANIGSAAGAAAQSPLAPLLHGHSMGATTHRHSGSFLNVSPGSAAARGRSTPVAAMAAAARSGPGLMRRGGRMIARVAERSLPAGQEEKEQQEQEQQQQQRGVSGGSDGPAPSVAALKHIFGFANNIVGAIEGLSIASPRKPASKQQKQQQQPAIPSTLSPEQQQQQQVSPEQQQQQQVMAAAEVMPPAAGTADAVSPEVGFGDADGDGGGNGAAAAAANPVAVSALLERQARALERVKERLEVLHSSSLLGPAGSGAMIISETTSESASATGSVDEYEREVAEVRRLLAELRALAMEDVNLEDSLDGNGYLIASHDDDIAGVALHNNGSSAGPAPETTETSAYYRSGPGFEPGFGGLYGFGLGFEEVAVGLGAMAEAAASGHRSGSDEDFVGGLRAGRFGESEWGADVAAADGVPAVADRRAGSTGLDAAAGVFALPVAEQLEAEAQRQVDLAAAQLAAARQAAAEAAAIATDAFTSPYTTAMTAAGTHLGSSNGAGNGSDNGASSATTMVSERFRQEEEPVSEPQVFNWTAQWYPVAVASLTDPSRPHAVTLMGRHLVLWRDAAGVWRAFEDACPHRLAPLSEGRIEKDGSLLCAYHAWRFDGTGRCTHIPQAKDAAAQDLALRNPRSCARAYPTTTAQDLIWVWGEAGPGAYEASQARPPTLVPGLDEMLANGTAAVMPWSFRDLPYSADTFVENVIDSSHVPVSHHNLAGNRYRDPLAMEVVQLQPVTQQGGFVLRSLKSWYPDVDFTDINFVPPGHVRNVQFKRDGAQTMITLYVTPTKPGWCRAFVRQARVKGPNGSFSSGFAGFMDLPLPKWIGHIAGNKFLQQDLVLLHAQMLEVERTPEDQRFTQKYFMPTTADKAVIAFRAWWEAFSGGGVPYAQRATPAAAATTSTSRNSHGSSGGSSSTNYNNGSSRNGNGASSSGVNRSSSSSSSSNNGYAGSDIGTATAAAATVSDEKARMATLLAPPLRSMTASQRQQQQLQERIDKAVLFDIYSSHTANCTACQGAVRGLKRGKAAATAAAVVGVFAAFLMTGMEVAGRMYAAFLASSMAAAAAAAAAAATAKGGSAAAAAAAAAAAMASGSAGGDAATNVAWAALTAAPPPLLAWVALALAAVCCGMAALCEKLIGLMHYQPFSHVDNN